MYAAKVFYINRNYTAKELMVFYTFVSRLQVYFD